jgi:hypothetical protein
MTAFCDSAFTSVVFLSKFDGSSGDVAATDVSSYARTITFGNSAVIDDVQGFLGTTALHLQDAGADDPGEFYASVPDANELSIGANSAWTIEAWACHSGDSSRHRLFGKLTSSGAQREYALAVGSGLITFQAYQPSSTLVFSLSTAHSLDPGSMHHIAVERFEDSIAIYQNGTLSASKAYAGSFETGTSPFFVGKIRDTPFDDQQWAGWIDEFRFTNGYARYQGAFTSPTSSFPTSQQTANDSYFLNVVLLTKLDGSSGDVTATDVSSYGRTLTFGDSAVINPAGKFNEGVLLADAGAINPSEMFVSAADAIELSVEATSAWTIEGYIRLDGDDSIRTWYSKYNNNSNERESWAYVRSGNLIFSGYSNGSTLVLSATAAHSLGDGLYHHVAIERYLDSIAIYQDGFLASSLSFTGSLYNGSSLLYIGKFRSTGFDDHPFDGMIDEVRLTKGVARYKGPFTTLLYSFPTSLHVAPPDPPSPGLGAGDFQRGFPIYPVRGFPIVSFRGFPHP